MTDDNNVEDDDKVRFFYQFPLSKCSFSLAFLWTIKLIFYFLELFCNQQYCKVPQQQTICNTSLCGRKNTGLKPVRWCLKNHLFFNHISTLPVLKCLEQWILQSSMQRVNDESIDHINKTNTFSNDDIDKRRVTWRILEEELFIFVPPSILIPCPARDVCQN